MKAAPTARLTAAFLGSALIPLSFCARSWAQSEARIDAVNPSAGIFANARLADEGVRAIPAALAVLPAEDFATIPPAAAFAATDAADVESPTADIAGAASPSAPAEGVRRVSERAGAQIAALEAKAPALLRRIRPLILINTGVDPEGRPQSREAYVKAVVEAGGRPLLVPPSPRHVLKRYLALADGVLFTGGADLPPKFYGDKPWPETKSQLDETKAISDRDLMELALESSKPAFGICLGLQLFNVVLNGGLIQHLATAVAHRDKGDTAHAVHVFSGTKLAALLGAGTITVNSFHHQAVDPRRLGRGVKISAMAPDGTIEGLELEDASRPFSLFVQWHPERIFDARHRRALFGAFVEACRRIERAASA